MCRHGVLVHCPSRLSAAATGLAAKLPCGDGMSTTWTREFAKAVHHLDDVMSHSFNCSCLSRRDSELKLPRHIRERQVVVLAKSVNECGW
jgi:hypothetical protein